MHYDSTPSSDLPSLQEHPDYRQAIAHMDAGQWQQALELFQVLQIVYPDNAEAKKLFSEAQMRATLARSQPRYISKETKRRNTRRFIVGTLVVIIITIAAYVAYEVWIDPLIIQELRVRQVTELRNKADEAIAAGDYAQARQTLQQIQEILPEDPETLEALQRIERVEKLSKLYDEAQALMAAGNWDQAIEVLTELESLDTQYRDLPQLLQVAQESLALDGQFQAAEEAFARGDWSTAIAQYEALQQTNLTFRFEDIQTRLFESQLKYGQTLLEEAGSDPDRVTEVLSHFSKALKLRPIDPDALKERRLAETYLAALNSEDQDEMIDLLQIIYSEQPDYAGQEAAELLYTTLLARASSYLAVGNEAEAIADYRVAAELLVEDSSEAQQKLAELTSEATSQ